MWKCPKCKREFQKINQQHSCVNYPIENHFKGKEDVGKPLFEQFVKKIEENIGPVKIESLPCCIHLLSSYTFAGVWILQNKIRFDIRLDRNIDHPKITKKVKVSPNRVMFMYEIENEKDIDSEMIDQLRMAYNLPNTGCCTAA